MIDPEECPLPVALPLARFLGAATAPDRIRHGADAAHAIIKYVALVRLADWMAQGLRGAEDAAIEAVDYVLGAPSAIHWWSVATALEDRIDLAQAPETPSWRERQRDVESAARARKFRHLGGRPRDDHRLEAETSNALQAIARAAEPVLRLPLVRRSDGFEQLLVGTAIPDSGSARWGIAARIGTNALSLDPFALALEPDDEHTRQDLFIYERMVGATAFYECDHELRVVERRFESLEGLIELVRLRREEEASRVLLRKMGQDVTGEALASSLCQAASDQVHQERRFLPIDHVERAEVSEALGAIGETGQRLLALCGPSGIGKTRELAEWMSACIRKGRIPLWVRAASWRGEGLSELLGKALTGQPLPLPLAQAQQAVSERGLSIGIDGINEAERPGELLASLLRDLEEMQPSPVQVVVGVRPEGLQAVRAVVPTAWWSAPTRFPDGVVRIDPLPIQSARRLWLQAEQSGAPPFDQLPPVTRRLLQVPLMAALGVQAGKLGTAPRVEAQDLIEQFVALQSTDIERIILRRLAALMYERATQTLDAGALLQDAGLSRIEHPYDVVAPAVQRLADCGLLRVNGTLQASRELELAFAHDRLLQWFVGRWLKDRAEGGEDARRGPPGTSWGTALSSVAGSPALASGVGQAIAALEPAHPGLLYDLLSSPDPETRAAGRFAARSLPEIDFRKAEEWRDSAWRRASNGSIQRREIAALAADAGDSALLADSLRDRALRMQTTAALARLRRYSPEIVHETLYRAWSNARRRPWLHLPTTLVTLRALLQAMIAEGASPQGDEVLDRLAREIASRLLGKPGGVLRPVLRAGVVEAFAWIVPGAFTAMPANWIDSRSELPRFFSRSKSDRARLRPIVDLFAGDASPAEVRTIALEVAEESDAVATTILERGLIAAALWSPDPAAALDLNARVGAVAQAQRSVPMAAQSVLYVLDRYLTRCPSALDWGARFSEFEGLLRGWLTAAPDRRWTAASGRRYKAVFAAAHVGLWHGRGMGGSPIMAELWDRALARDESLAVDLLDDMSILALSRGNSALALAESESFLRSDWLPPRVRQSAVRLLSGIGNREPEVLQRNLEGPGENRAALARLVRIEPSEASAQFLLALDFDDLVALSEAARPMMAKVLELAIEVGSFHEFASSVLRMVANRVTGEQMFAERRR